MTKDKKFKIISGICSLLFWLAVWQILSMIIDSNLLLPSPLKVAKAFPALITSGDFYLSVLTSIADIVGGCIIGMLIGVFLALLTNRWTLARAIFAPAVSVVRAVPVASFIVIVYVFVRGVRLSINSVSIICTAMMVIPIMWSAVTSAYENIGKEYIEVGKIYSFGFFKRFRVIYIPFAIPYLMNGFSNSVGLAWKAGIAAEVICNVDKTIGHYIAESKFMLDAEVLFAVTIIVIIISMLIEKMIKLATARMGN